MSTVLLSEWDRAEEGTGVRSVCREATVMTDHRIQAGQRGSTRGGKGSEKMVGVEDCQSWESRSELERSL